MKKKSKIIQLVFSCFIFSFPCSSFGNQLPSHVISLSGERILYADLATADFNNDGYKEIVAGGQDGILYVLATTNGTDWSTVWLRETNLDLEAANPPTHRAETEIASAPAIADLDEDGNLEIIVTVGGDIHVEDINGRENGGVLVYGYTGEWNFPLKGDWPQPKIDRVGSHCPSDNPGCTDTGFSYPDGLWDGIMTTPAIGDIDGDGDLEIVAAGIDRRIHAWHHTGQVVSGWPICRDEGWVDCTNTGDLLLRGGLSSPALGDINRDGKLDVVVATMSPLWDLSQPVVYPINPDYSVGTLWAFNGDSSTISGFPVATEQWFHSSPALGDIDGDGYLEIVIGSGYGLSGGRENIVSVFNHDGSALPNWPRETQGTTPASPSLADIDSDGALEVIVGCGSKNDHTDCGAGTAKLYAWNADGSSVSGFPSQPGWVPAPWNPEGSYSMPFSPVIVNYDADASYEILINSIISWGITVVSSNGVPIAKLKIGTDDQVFPGLTSGPLAEDIDNDDKLEVIIGGGLENEGMVFIWDVEGSASAERPWPMGRQNTYRIGTLIENISLFLSPLPSPPLNGTSPIGPNYLLLRN